MAVAVAYEVEPALALEAQLTSALCENEQLHVVDGLEVGHLQSVGSVAEHRALVDFLYEAECLLQQVVFLACCQLYLCLSLHQHHVGETVYNPILTEVVETATCCA